MRNEVSAGGVVYNPKLKKILLIKDFRNKWALPKGWIEKGDKPEETAVREVCEETGLKNVKILAPLGEIEFFYTATENRDYGLKKGERVHKKVIFFLMETDEEKLKPQWEINGAEWFAPNEVEKKAGYSNVKEILRKALEIIGKM